MKRVFDEISVSDDEESPICFPEEEQTQFFYSGSNFTIGITTNGNAYGWGENEFVLGGETTTPKRIDVEPSLIPSGERLVWTRFVCGDNHVFGFSSVGVFVWGRNVMMQLGLGDREDRTTPHLLRSPDHSPWVDIVCADLITYGQTQNGNIYEWGDKFFKQLEPHNDCKKRTVKTPELQKTWKRVFSHRSALYSIKLASDGTAFVMKPEMRIIEIAMKREKDMFKYMDSVSRIRSLPSGSLFGKWKTFYCGDEYFIGVDVQGRVFIWGFGMIQELSLTRDENTGAAELPLPSLDSTPDSENFTWDNFFCGNGRVIGILKTTEDMKLAFTWSTHFTWKMLGVPKENTCDEQYDESSPYYFLPSLDEASYWTSFSFEQDSTIGVTSRGQILVWGNNLVFSLEDKSQPCEFPLSVDDAPWCVYKESQQILRASTRFDISMTNSDLVSLRCPMLVDSEGRVSSSTLSKDALEQLVRLIHGKFISTMCPFVLFEIYEFIIDNKSQAPQLVDFQLEIILGIAVRMNRDNIFRVIEKSDQMKIVSLMNVAVYHCLANYYVDVFNTLDLDLRLSEMEICSLTNNLIVRAHVDLSFLHCDMKFPNFDDAKPLEHYMKELLTSGKGSDFTIVVKNEHIPVHRFVLGARNSYFERVFQTRMDETTKKKINLSKIPLSPSSMRKLLEYFYCGRISIPPTIAESIEILISVDYLLLEKDTDLIALCKDISEQKIEVDEISSVLHVAKKWKQDDLLDQLFKSFIDQRKDHKNYSSDWDNKLASFFIQLMKKKKINYQSIY